MSPNMSQPMCVVITGPVGAGKSTTAAELRELLGTAGTACVLFDMDFLRQTYPEPDGDPFGAELGYRVLADAWRHTRAASYGDHGPMRIAILADVVEHPDQRQKYQDALPDTEVVIVRLNVAQDELVRRLEVRERERFLEWYRNRAVELQQIMEQHGVGDLVIDVADRGPIEVAQEIAEGLHLLPAPR